MEGHVADQLVKEKVAQAVGILNELDIDMWMLVGREMSTLCDPSIPIVVGAGATWPSAFIITRGGEAHAIVGTGDVAQIEAGGIYTPHGYVMGWSEPLRAVISQFDPRTIALNYSMDNDKADGLTYGMWLNLNRALAGTPYPDRFISAEPIASRVRGRKSPEERARIKHACAETERLFREMIDWVRIGTTEQEIHRFLHDRCRERGYGLSWEQEYDPTVTAGDKSPIGHVGPTTNAVEKGKLLRIDFGITIDGYSSDMQRTWYFLRDDETDAPPPVKRDFETVARAIQEGFRAVRPGIPGWQVDKAARDFFEERGKEWRFALGHQLGHVAHDGGGGFYPRWERYGEKPNEIVEVGQCYVLEIGAFVEGYGPISLEDDLEVTEDGAQWFVPPQTELLLVRKE
jgi:Xaa-Pro aminopeptidase